MKDKKDIFIALLIVILVVLVGGLVFTISMLTGSDNADEYRTVRCFSEIGNQFGYEIEKTIYEFNNGLLKKITMDDVIYFSGHDVTGNEYKENKYILSNFCLNNNKCYSKQYGGMLSRGLIVDFDNPDDYTKYNELKNITIEQILTNDITGNDLSSRHQICFEVK